MAITILIVEVATTNVVGVDVAVVVVDEDTVIQGLSTVFKSSTPALGISSSHCDC